MWEYFLYLFGSGHNFESILGQIRNFGFYNIFSIVGYFGWLSSVFGDSFELCRYMKFMGEIIRINDYFALTISITMFILFNYIIFRVGKYFKFRKLKITEKNKNYFLFYAKFMPIGYIISNFILGGNSKYNFKQIFLYGLLGILLNICSLLIYSLFIFITELPELRYRLTEFDLFFNNILFLLFTIFYFINKKRSN